LKLALAVVLLSGIGIGADPQGSGGDEPDLYLTDQAGNETNEDDAIDRSAADTAHPDARASSSVVCWGVNRSSYWNRNQTDVPMELQAGGVAEVSTGRLHTCAMMVDGGARCWGDNSHGQSTVPSSGPNHGKSVNACNVQSCIRVPWPSIACSCWRPPEKKFRLNAFKGDFDSIHFS